MIITNVSKIAVTLHSLYIFKPLRIWRLSKHFIPLYGDVTISINCGGLKTDDLNCPSTQIKARVIPICCEKRCAKKNHEHDFKYINLVAHVAYNKQKNINEINGVIPYIETEFWDQVIELKELCKSEESLICLSLEVYTIMLIPSSYCQSLKLYMYIKL